MKNIKIKCSECQKTKSISNFYSSNNVKYEDLGVIPYCKDCCKKKIMNKDGTLSKREFNNLLRDLDKPFIISLYEDVKNDSINKVIGNYVKELNLHKEYKNLTYKDSIKNKSDILSKENTTIINGSELINKARNENSSNKGQKNKKNKGIIENSEAEVFTEKTKNDYMEQQLKESEKSKKDCIEFFGYDPFEDEVEEDKPVLYNSLESYLDTSTREDTFKQPVVIQIVKTFNQINKIDKGLSEILSDPNNIIKSENSIQKLTVAKGRMLKSILDLAKDNGISINYNNNKSRGGNTLNGINKRLSEIGIDQAQLNLFDIKTCVAMRQVANISNGAISQQLMLDENDEKQMLDQQREIINNLRQENEELKEENRLLKKAQKEVGG